jgi:HEPN domain-containing protein
MSEARNQLVWGWLLRAERDLAAARVLAKNDNQMLDMAIYHCQQGAEKAIKGFLLFFDEPFGRTHDIEALIRLATLHNPAFAAWVEAGVELTPYATLFRYPGPVVVPSQAQFDRALNLAQGLYDLVLASLPDEVWPADSPRQASTESE